MRAVPVVALVVETGGKTGAVELLVSESIWLDDMLFDNDVVHGGCNEFLFEGSSRHSSASRLANGISTTMENTTARA